MADTLAKIGAFIRRACARETGTHPEIGKGLRSRAAKALAELQQPTDSLAFRSRLEMLKVEYDLFDEEHASDEIVLLLQTRILELAGEHEAAREIATEMLAKPPVAKLFAAVLAQARIDDANEVRYELSHENSQIKCMLKVGATWTEAMTIPEKLWPPILGFATRFKHAGYDLIKPHLMSKTPLPTNVIVEALSADSFRVRL